MNAALSQVRAQVSGGAVAFALFAALASAFFLSIGTSPLAMLAEIGRSALGDGYALGETLLRATPILLCALATIIPARAGLISVGAEGQMYFGALAGTGVLLALNAPSTSWMLPLTLLAGALGGALWAAVPALLRIGANANETISTLLLNYVAALLVTWLVYGAWKNPQSQGWPSSIDFLQPLACRCCSRAGCMAACSWRFCWLSCCTCCSRARVGDLSWT
jgi:ABC-type uncharacterized transport system permease subunit